MKSNTIWWIVLIAVVVLGVYFLVVNREPVTSPEPEFQDVMPGTVNPPQTNPSLSPGADAPVTGSPAAPLPAGENPVSPDQLNVNQQPGTVDSIPTRP